MQARVKADNRFEGVTAGLRTYSKTEWRDVLPDWEQRVTEGYADVLEFRTPELAVTPSASEVVSTTPQTAAPEQMTATPADPVPNVVGDAVGEPAGPAES